MAWQDVMVLTLRHLISDPDGASYSDEQLEESILIAAQIVRGRMTFDADYTIVVATETLSPDPTTSDPVDYAFMNIVCLDAACRILQAELKYYALRGCKVTDGPSTIDMTSVFRNLQDLYKLVRDQLDKEEFSYKMNGVSGYAITTPTTVVSLPSRMYFG